ncbi:MAG: helix-turn-helix domain-containing protein [Spirochaetaceae bacterium]|jgi:AraC-like DNA-binding protein|nr:helix-turn-helix domain-containing protein [Spirochaetaceae bacterium]
MKRGALRIYLAYSGFRRLFASFFILLCVVLAGSSILFYAVFSRTLETELSAANQDMLNKVRNTIDIFYGQTMTLAAQMASADVPLIRVMFEKERDRVLEYQAMLNLKSYLVSHPIISYFALYNESLENGPKLFSLVDFLPGSEMQLLNLAGSSYQKGRYSQTFPLSLQAVPRNPQNPPVLYPTITQLVYSPLTRSDNKGALIFGIDCLALQNLINDVNKGQLDNVIVLSPKGTVISAPDKNMLFTSYESPVWTAVQNNGEEGFLVMKDQGKNVCVNWTHSSNLGWVFINLTSYDTIMKQVLNMRNFSLLISAIFLVASFLGSGLAAWRIHAPLRRILSKLNYKPDAGKNEELYLEDRLEALESPFYAVCVFSFEEEQRDKASLAKLEETAQHIMAECATVETAPLSSQAIAVILHLQQPQIPAEAELLIAETCEVAKKYLSLEVNAAIGSVVDSIFAVADSAEEARSLMKKHPKEPAPLWIESSIEMAEKKYMSGAFSVVSAAQYYKITPSYFNRVFKKFRGISYSEYLNQVRMGHASALLIQGYDAANDIAQAVGISNTTYFYTLFKKYYGLTPQEYRQQYKK